MTKTRQQKEKEVYIYISWFILIVLILIYFLDYYPFTKVEFKNGYCTNTQTNIYRVYKQNGKMIGIYYYDTKIYDEIDGTYIGSAQGCYGTTKNSYARSAGMGMLHVA